MLRLVTCSPPQRYPAEVSDLISEGEIGSGTCGQVFKVRFKKTGHVIAVKVSLVYLQPQLVGIKTIYNSTGLHFKQAVWKRVTLSGRGSLHFHVLRMRSLSIRPPL